MKHKSIVWISILVLSGSLNLFSQGQFRVLVYTSPDYWHNTVIPTAISEFRKMAEKHFFELEWTQEPSRFNNESLREFSVAVFLNANGATLNQDEMKSFREYIRKGGGFVGIHAASVTQELDEWMQKLVGRVFIGHPEKQTAVLTVTDRHFPACLHLPDQWLWTDEWYEFGDALTGSMHVVLRVEESTYDARITVDGEERNGMGSFHPISWYQEYDGGRSFYTALGHLEAHYTDARFLEHIYGGIFWAATGKGIPANTADQY